MTNYNAWIHYDAAVLVAQILNTHGFEAYLIGGAVRDLLLGHTPKDFDLVTNATPEQILNLKELVKSSYQDTSQAFGVTRVIVSITEGTQTHQSEIEIATYRRDIEAHLGRKLTKVEFTHLDDDLKRRDLTINALAFDPLTSQLIDFEGGLDDLDNKLIRFIGEPSERIKEDPLRTLRAIRFKTQLGFKYETNTKAALKNAVQGGVLKAIAPERIKVELTRMFTHSSRVAGLKDLDSLGALGQLLPEVTAGKGVAQPPQFHSEGDVWKHQLLAMSYLPDIIGPRLAWATLLHDIGKPPTTQAAELTKDRIRFNDHYSVGAQMARKVLQRLRFSNKFIEEVAWMVHYHLAIDDLPKMRPKRQEQFMSHPAFADLLELHRADAHAAWSIMPDGSIDSTEAHFPALDKLWADFQKRAATHPPSLKRDLGVDGSWLIKNFGLVPGAALGSLLDELESAYLDGEITTLDEVKHFLEQRT